MAGKQIVQTIKFNFQGDITNLRNSITGIQNAMQNVNLPKGSTTAINKDLEQLSNKLKELENKNKNGMINLGDASSIERISKKISEIFNSLNTEMRNMGGLSDKILPPDVLKRFKALEDNLENSKKKAEDLEKATKKINDAKATRSTKNFNLKKEENKKVIKEEDYNNLKNFQKAEKAKNKIEENAKINGKTDKRKYTKADKESIAEYERLKQVIEAAGYSAENVTKTLRGLTTQSKIDDLRNQFELANIKVEELEKNLNDLKSATGNVNLNNLKEQASQLGVNIEGANTIDELQNRINAFKTEQITKAKTEFDKLNQEMQEGTKKAENLDKKISQEMNGVVNSTSRANQEFAQLTSRLQYFFGAANAIQLFKRALREAFKSVKELDGAMKQIAVVSKYNIGDMWDTLPQFTKQANELGVAITDVYNATGLYVQQGLKLAESQGLANETLKMAKIAGMEAAAATDAMTSALRGFNMELDKSSAEKVNDIYSKLAAITASDTQEIATAMSKTASIANNAGASIENTAAFLSQIIETTRESAETAGTALKTVIARFSELKKNPVEISNVDGEVVDANNIESALKLAGVDLRDAMGQFRDFDDVIIELSGKWSGLDKNTQRYIATMAAGSRQQSRFLALMSDNERLLQLTDAAYNSTGSSQAQFNKTLDSMESKLSQLKNAWDTFTRNLMNSELMKAGIDILTTFLTALNGITNGFSWMGSVVGTLLSTGFLANLFVNGAILIDKFLASIKRKISDFSVTIGQSIRQGFDGTEPQVKEEGNQGGEGYGTAFEMKFLTKIDQAIQKARGKLKQFNKDSDKILNKNKVGNGGKSKINNKTKKPKNYIASTKDHYISETDGQKYAHSKKDPYAPVVPYNPKLQGKVTFDPQKAQKSLNLVGAAATTAAIAVSMLAQTFRKAGNEKAAKVLEGIASTLSVIGVVAPIAAMAIQMLGKKGEKALQSLKTKGGWVALILMAIAGLITVISKAANDIAKNSPEGKLKSLTQASEKATAAAQKAQEAYSNWLSDKNEYSGLLDTIKELTQGTEAWSQQMDKIQDKVYEMINTYPDLAQYVQEDGTFTEDGLYLYEQKLKQQKEYNMGARMVAQMQKESQQYEVDSLNLAEEKRKELKKLTKGSEQYNKKEAYYTQKQKELDTNYQNSLSGQMNYLVQNAGVNGVVADNISNVLTKKSSFYHTMADTKTIDSKNYNEYQSAENWETYGTVGIGAAAGAGAAIVAGVVAGLASGPVGWIALAAAAVGAGVTAIISGIQKNKKLKELQEEYAEAFGIDVDQIDESIKEDAEALARQVENLDAYKEFEKRAKEANTKIALHGEKAMKLFAADLSLLDEDFSEYGGYTGWLGTLGDIDKDFLDDAITQFEAEKKRVEEIIKDSFGDTVQLQINAEVDSIIISGKDAQKLADAQKIIEENYGEKTIDVLNQVTRSYKENGYSIYELIDAQEELSKSSSKAQTYSKILKMLEDGSEGVKQIAEAFLEENTANLNATEQFKEFYMNLSSEQLNEIFKNGKATTEVLYNLKESLVDLGYMSETTGVTLSGMADGLNYLREGIIGIEDLTNNFITTIDNLNKAVNVLNDSMAAAKAFKEPDSGTIIGEKTGSVAEAALKLWNEGRFGDTKVIEAYIDYLFGEGEWEKALKKAEGNARKAMSGYIDFISNLSKETNFFDLWASTASQSNGLWKVEGGTIHFDLGKVKDYQDLVNQIDEITHWGVGAIKNALADFSVYSNDFTNAINQLSAFTALDDYVNSIKLNDKNQIELNENQLKIIFEEGFSDLGFDFEYFKQRIEEFFNLKGISTTTTTAPSQYEAENILQKSKMAGQSGTAILSNLFKYFYEQLGDATLAVENVRTYIKSQDMAALGITDDDLLKSSTWRTDQASQDELNAIKNADLINEGTWNAAQSIVKTLYTVSGKSSDFKEQGYSRTESINQGLSQNTGKASDLSNVKLENQNQFSSKDIFKIKIDLDVSGYRDLLEKMKESYYEEVDFDWMNNFNELGEKSVRTLEELQSEYELMLKTLSGTPEEVADNLFNQYLELESQKKISAAGADAAKQRLDNTINNPNNKWLFDERYVWSENGMTMIDWDKLNAARTDENIPEGARKALDEIKNNNDIINKDKQTQKDLSLQQEELLEKIDDSIVDYQKQIKDMLISEYEKEIDKLSQIDSSINNANSKLISSIQSSLNRDRQNRDNEEKERNIEDMQNRLALLRADTTGANRQDILSLEKELGETQEDYTDTLIDQKISALQEQNEKASEQRQEQIAIAKDQLQSAEDNGQISKEVEQLMKAGLNFDDPQNPLAKLWNNYVGAGLTKAEFENQKKDFSATAIAGQGAFAFKQLYDGEKLDDAINTALQNGVGLQLNNSLGTIGTAIAGLDIYSKAQIDEMISKIKAEYEEKTKPEQPTQPKTMEEYYKEAGMAEATADYASRNTYTGSHEIGKTGGAYSKMLTSYIANTGKSSEEATKDINNFLTSKKGYTLDAAGEISYIPSMETIAKNTDLTSLVNSNKGKEYVNASTFKSTYDTFRGLASAHYSEKDISEFIKGLGLNEDLSMGEKTYYFNKGSIGIMYLDDNFWGQEQLEAKTTLGLSTGSDSPVKVPESKINETISVNGLSGFVPFTKEELNKYGIAGKPFDNALSDSKNGIVYIYKDHFTARTYKKGGLSTYTGPAWLDGTPSKPELVLNAQDTKNFLQLKDILSSIMSGAAFNTTTQKDGDINLEIYLNVEQGISSDYDVEKLVNKVKQEIARVGSERNIQILTKR